MRGKTTLQIRSAAAALVVGLVCAFASGCAHKTVIRTVPEGARVMVDGVDMGESPVVVERATGTQGKLRVQAEMESFETTRVEVERSEWFLWPALLAIVPTLGLTVVWIPIAGPIIAVGWAVATSPSLFGLAFLRRYPDEIVVELKPRVSVFDGGLLPTDAWTVPEEYAPNPVPLPPEERGERRKKDDKPTRPLDEDAQPLPLEREAEPAPP